MSALGQKRTLRLVSLMSALPPKADMVERDRDVRFVPIADIMRSTRTARRLADVADRENRDRAQSGHFAPAS